MPHNPSPDQQPSCPRYQKLMARIERCAATEREGYLDAPLTQAIIAQDNRELLAEAKKNLPQRLLAAFKGLSAEERNDQRAIERAFTKATETLMSELGIL